MAVVHAQVELLSRYWDAVDTQRVDSEVAKMVMSDSSGRRKTLYVARPTPWQNESHSSHPGPPACVRMSVRHQRHLVARVPRDIKLQIIRDDLRARRFKYIRAVREYNQQVHDIMQAATKLKLAMKVTSLLISNKDDVRAAQCSAARCSAVQCSAGTVYGFGLATLCRSRRKAELQWTLSRTWCCRLAPSTTY